MEEVCVCVTDEEGVVLEDVSGVDSGHVLIRGIAAVLVVINFTTSCASVDFDRLRILIHEAYLEVHVGSAWDGEKRGDVKEGAGRRGGEVALHDDLPIRRCLLQPVALVGLVCTLSSLLLRPSR